MNSSTGNAPPTTATRTIGGATSELCTMWVNPNTRISEAGFEEMVLETMRNSLHKLSIAQLENILEMRRREE